MKVNLVSVICALFFLTISCKDNKEAAKDKQEPKKEAHKEHWSYQGETSPEHWAEIEKESDCSGQNQSPINIVDVDAKKVNVTEYSLKTVYNPKTVLHSVTNNGHSIQFDLEKGDSIQYKNEAFNLVQLHFHEPSEHLVNGVRYPLEIHLVHKSKKGNYTVLGVLAQEGEKSQLIEFFESFLPLKEGQTKEIKTATDLTTLFPVNKDYYSYSGSLTTPPCTENVNWIIFKQPIIVSVDEVLKLKKNMPVNNYRNEQPLHERVVQLNALK